MIPQSSRPRAADDFETIRARMEELRPATRPRAADDFAMIRARMDELRRERAQVWAETGNGSAVTGPKSNNRPTRRETEPEESRSFPRSVARRLLG
jgi:hypothetical protein